MRQFDADIVIVGSGLAGLSAALSLAPRRVVLVTKTAGIEGGSSLHAQGGIAAAIGAADRPSDHARDTMAAGDGLCDPVAVARLTDGGPQAIAVLRDLGVPFDVDPATGDLLLGREGVATVLFVTAIATAAVSTVFSVIAMVFTTQLYVVLAAQRRAADG